MNQNIDLKSAKAALKKLFAKLARHSIFAVILTVLVTYLVVVWRISQLAIAEPTDDSLVTAETAVPRIDKKAIEQIQQLEQNSPDLKSLFNSARDNPFQE